MGQTPPQPLIYVVDDQATLLDLAEVSLKGEPYRVKTFLDPVDALEMFRQEPVKPDLLITDYAMDQMNGLELIEQCKSEAPTLKSILISGTLGAEIISQTPIKVNQFLGKPYQPANLAELVRQVLQES